MVTNNMKPLPKNRLSTLLNMLSKNETIYFTTSQKEINLFKDRTKKYFLTTATHEEKHTLIKTGCIKEEHNSWHITPRAQRVILAYNQKKEHTLGLEQSSVNNDNNANYTLTNLKENPLLWLAQHKNKNGKPWLETYHIDAAQRLYSDFIQAGLQAHVTLNYDLSHNTKNHKNTRKYPLNLSEKKIIAKDRLKQALTHLDNDIIRLLLDVCCYQHGLEEVEKKYRWPRRSAKLILRFALSTLAKNYNTTPKNTHNAHKIQFWFAKDSYSKISDSL